MRILSGAIGVLATGVMLTSGALAPADLLQTYSAHHAAVNALAMTPDGAVGFSAGKDGKVILWDAATGDELMTIPACQVAINDIAISPDGTLAATAGADGFLKIWDAQTGELVTAIAAHSKACNTVAWTDMSTASLRVYSGGDDGYLRGYSVDDDYAMVQEWHANEGGVNVVEINESGSYAFTGGVDGRVCVFSINGGTRESVIQAYENAEVLCLAFNSLENCLLSGGTSGEDGKVKLWNHEGDLCGQFQAHVLGVRDFLLEDDYMITGGSDFKIRAWQRNF